MAMMVLTKPGPSTAEITIIITMPGMAWMMSSRRMTMLSTQPPKKPATAPMAMPITSARPVASTPLEMEYRAPISTRLKISRPISSQPKGCASEGVAKQFIISIAV